MSIVRVVRVLEYIGPEDWVRKTLETGYITAVGERLLGPGRLIRSGTVQWEFDSPPVIVGIDPLDGGIDPASGGEPNG